jgi:hypothetical protein
VFDHVEVELDLDDLNEPELDEPGEVEVQVFAMHLDKLGNMGPVGDAWAALREATQAGRPAD